MKRIVFALSLVLLFSVNVDAKTAEEEYYSEADILDKVYYKIYPEYRELFINNSKQKIEDKEKIGKFKDKKIKSKETKKWNGNQHSIIIFDDGTYSRYGLIINDIVIDGEVISVIPVAEASGFGVLGGCSSVSSGSGYFTCYGASAYADHFLGSTTASFSYTLANQGPDVISYPSAVATPLCKNNKTHYKKYEGATGPAFYVVEYAYAFTHSHYETWELSVFVGDDDIWVESELDDILWMDSADYHYIDCDVYGTCPE